MFSGFEQWKRIELCYLFSWRLGRTSRSLRSLRDARAWGG